MLTFKLWGGRLIEAPEPGDRSVGTGCSWNIVYILCKLSAQRSGLGFYRPEHRLHPLIVQDRRPRSSMRALAFHTEISESCTSIEDDNKKPQMALESIMYKYIYDKGLFNRPVRTYTNSPTLCQHHNKIPQRAFRFNKIQKVFHIKSVSIRDPAIKKS